MGIKMPVGIFVDTGVFAAYVIEQDSNHERAVQILSECMAGTYGPVLTSDFVYDETLTLTLARTRRCDTAIHAHKLILGDDGELPRFVHMLIIDDTIRKQAYSEFQTTCKDGLSFTDTTTLVLMKVHEISTIATFDLHFRGRAIVIG
jgi:predicted nucleic acid-binding protein